MEIIEALMGQHRGWATSSSIRLIGKFAKPGKIARRRICGKACSRATWSAAK